MNRDPQSKLCQLNRLSSARGFVAALDQSGGSTPSMLANYGIEPAAYENEEDMFALVQQMRERIVTAPPFVGSKILATILFEKTMDSHIQGRSMSAYLWEQRGITTFIKVDKGIESERSGVQLMRPIPDLNCLLHRSLEAGAVGTKMRSLILRADAIGISQVIEQQFDLAHQIHAVGLVPIVEPEVSMRLPEQERASAEMLLRQELERALSRARKELKLILKLTLPFEANLYEPLVGHPNVIRVLALSGGLPRADACRRLRMNRGMIASFSRAFLEGLTVQMHNVHFNETLTSAINEIFWASVDKVV